MNPFGLPEFFRISGAGLEEIGLDRVELVYPDGRRERIRGLVVEAGKTIAEVLREECERLGAVIEVAA